MTEKADLEKQLSQRARSALNRSLEQVDAKRLAEIRALALASRPNLLRYYVPVAGIAASLLVAVLYWQNPVTAMPEIYADPIEQAAAMDMEFLDDVELVAWLLVEPTA